MNVKELEELKTSIDELNELKDNLKERREHFDLANAILIDAITVETSKQAGLKALISDRAKEEYKQTNNKKLLGGIGIQERITIEYDEDLALSWANKHNMCIKLDASAFNKIAKIQDIDFVTKDTIILVTFPKEIKF